MTYNQAKRNILKWRMIAVIIGVPATISSVISVLKMFYSMFGNADPLSSALANVAKNLVTVVYQHTTWLSFFWNHSPTPNPQELATTQNIFFALIYLMIFVAMAFWGAARSLNVRLKDIQVLIENEKIRRSLQGEPPLANEAAQNSVPVNDTELFSKFHALYLAPIIAAVIAAAIVKFAGLS